MGNPREVTGIFLQVRLNSTRLPRKALLPLAGMTVIEHAMAALIEMDADVHALLTDERSAAALVPYAEKWGFKVFPGPAEDVLHRYVLAAKHFGVTTIVRATGDNPLVSRYLAEEILDRHLRESADYSGYLGMPLGTGVEILKAEALVTAAQESVSRYEREHVSPFIYVWPDRFTVCRPQAGDEFQYPDYRVTLDTDEDYRRIQHIYDQLYTFQPIETDRLVEWLLERDEQGAERHKARATEKVPM